MRVGSGGSVKIEVWIFYPQENVANRQLGTHERNTEDTVYPCSFGNFLKFFDSCDHRSISALPKIKR